MRRRRGCVAPQRGSGCAASSITTPFSGIGPIGIGPEGSRSAVRLAEGARHHIPELPGTGRSGRPSGSPGIHASMNAHALNFTQPDSVAALIAAQLDGIDLTEAASMANSVEVMFDER